MILRSDLKWQTLVIDALQKATKTFLISEFKNKFYYWCWLWNWLLICIVTNLCTIHEHWVTLQMWDMLLVWMLQDHMSRMTYYSDDEKAWIFREDVIVM